MRKIYIAVRLAIQFVFLMMSIGGLASCAAVLSDVNIFNDKDEIELGNRFSKEIEKELSFCRLGRAEGETQRF